jgi:hypothetical protein
MRRYNPPFNGKRYLLNTNTGEIHDLDNETSYCRIDQINLNHIYMADSYEEAQIHAIFVSNISNPNGCYYCIPSKDNG